MRILLLFLLPLYAFTANSQDWTNKTRVLPDVLRKLPVAIYIMHSPNPNYPQLSNDSDRKDYKYVWKHATTVYSPTKDLEVIKAGSFIWYSENGWIKNVDYNKRTFAKRFECPKGLLKAGKHYTFEKNNRWGNDLYGGDALWYIIAKDKEGNLYKGIGLIETESEIK